MPSEKLQVSKIRESEPKADQKKSISYSEKHKLLKKAKEADCDCDCDCDCEGEGNKDNDDDRTNVFYPEPVTPENPPAAESSSRSSSSGKTEPDPVQCLEESWGRPVSRVEADRLNHWRRDFEQRGSPEAAALVCHAIGLSTLQNVRKMSYVEGVLKAWFSAGYLTVGQVDADEQQRSNRQRAHDNRDFRLQGSRNKGKKAKKYDDVYL
jgi:DnaD/phage-associated family protein